MADPALTTFLSEREKLISVALRVVENRAVAEELVQDSWLRWGTKAYPADKALPIFRRIVSNLALDWARRRHFETLIVSDAVLRSDDSPSSEEIVIARDELARVVRALQRLPKRTVRAFRMHFIDGLTYAEIGRRLGVSLSRAHALAEDALVEITIALSR